jgi:hypothetical protein
MSQDITLDVTPDTGRTKPRRRVIWAVIGMLAAGLLAAACSSGSTGPSVAGAGPATTSRTPFSGQSGTSGGSAQSTGLQYSQCMRAHGVTDFPDPSAQGGYNLGGPGSSDLNPNSPTFQAAERACSSLSAKGHLTPGQRAQDQAEGLRFSQCMRAHGIRDFPDPSASGGLFIQNRPGSDLDPNNPTFRAAQTACRYLSPKAHSQTSSNGGSSGGGGGSSSGSGAG